MSYEDKMAAVRAVIEQHNQAVGNKGQIDPDNFLEKVKFSGGTSEDRLKSFSHEQLLALMPEFDGVKPLAIARQVAEIFRDKHTNQPTVPYVSTKKADRMSLRELVEHYDPEESENAVGKRLREIAKDEGFIVFKHDLVVDVETTVMLLNELKKGFPGRESIDTDDGARVVYPIGVLPANLDLVDEDPLYPNRPLRPDGTSDQTRRSWEGVPLNVRQLIRLAVTTGEIGEIDADKAWTIHEMVIGPDAFQKIQKRYKKAGLKFAELEATGDLPKLKIKLGGISCRPFDKGKKVNFIVPQQRRPGHPMPQDNTWNKDTPSYNYICRKGQWYLAE